MEFTVAGTPVFAATGARPFDPAASTVVFLHGAGMDHSVWNLHGRDLAGRGRSVLAVDLPGHGRSAGPPRRTIADLADWVAALLDAAGVATAALVGHSMGALIALETAARHPARVRALALIGVAERMPVHPDLLAAAAANNPQAAALVVGWGFGRRGHLGGHPFPGVSLLHLGARVLERAAPGVLSADLEACNAYADGAAAAAAVSCPTLLLLGERDRMTRAKAGRALAARIAGARVAEFAGVGHMVMLEAPEETTAALSSFV